MVTEAPRSRPWQRVLDVVTTTAVLAASLVVIWVLVSNAIAPHSKVVVHPKKAVEGELPREPVPLTGFPVLGKSTARVALIEYSDFECRYCRTFAQQTLPKIVSAYVDTGRVLFAFASLPLERIHPSALRAAGVAECAIRQDMFWPTHDWLFKVDYRASADWLGAAVDVGLDLEALTHCLEGIFPKVRQGITTAEALHISGTPTFLAGTITNAGEVKVVERMAGVQSFDGLAKVLDGLISAADY